MEAGQAALAAFNRCVRGKSLLLLVQSLRLGTVFFRTHEYGESDLACICCLRQLTAGAAKLDGWSPCSHGGDCDDGLHKVREALAPHLFDSSFCFSNSRHPSQIRYKWSLVRPVLALCIQQTLERYHEAEVARETVSGQ